MAFSLFGRGKRKQGNSESHALFERLDQLLLDERAQLDHLPSDVREKILSNPACDSIPGVTGEYGRSPTSPIPVNGPLGEAIFLSSLRINGHPILFHRLGSMHAAVDVFEVVSFDGAVWDVLFVMPYFPRRSRLAPAGYRIEDGITRRFFGTTLRVEPFPHNLYQAIRAFTIRNVGMPLPNKLVREAIETQTYAAPQEHRMRVGELVRSKGMRLALTERDMDEIGQGEE